MGGRLNLLAHLTLTINFYVWSRPNCKKKKGFNYSKSKPIQNIKQIRQPTQAAANAELFIKA